MNRVEEQQLQEKMQSDHHEEDFDMDEASHRLNDIYERMQEVRSPGPWALQQVLYWAQENSSRGSWTNSWLLEPGGGVA